MNKNKVFLSFIIALTLIYSSLKIYVSHTHYFSLENLINHPNEMVRSVASYFLKRKLSKSSLIGRKNTLLQVASPSALGLPSEWVLSSEAINVMCDVLINDAKKEYLLFHLAYTSALYKEAEQLRFLNTIGNIKNIFQDVEQSLGKNFLITLNEESQTIISSGEVGEFKCDNH